MFLNAVPAETDIFPLQQVPQFTVVTHKNEVPVDALHTWHQYHSRFSRYVTLCSLWYYLKCIDYRDQLLQLLFTIVGYSRKVGHPSHIETSEISDHYFCHIFMSGIPYPIPLYLIFLYFSWNPDKFCRTLILYAIFPYHSWNSSFSVLECCSAMALFPIFSLRIPSYFAHEIWFLHTIFPY